MVRAKRQERLGLWLSTEEAADLDFLRRAEPDTPERAEAVRRLIRKAAAELRAKAKPKPKG